MSVDELVRRHKLLLPALIRASFDRLSRHVEVAIRMIRALDHDLVGTTVELVVGTVSVALQVLGSTNL